MTAANRIAIAPSRRAAGELTTKQAAFVRAYVKLGGLNAMQAALAAGYSGRDGGNNAAVVASRMLRMPHILSAIREETQRKLCSGVALGAVILEDLGRNATSESVRLQAAQALLDRGGMQLASLSEHHVVVEDRRSDVELLQRVVELQRELGLNAKVIDAEPPAPGAGNALPMRITGSVSDAVLIGGSDAE